MTTEGPNQREALLAAVSSIFGEAATPADHEPMAGLTTERVCAVAGLPKSELEAQFGSLRGLVESWFAERVFEAGIAASELPGAAEAGFAERLEAFCFVLLDVLDEFPGIGPRVFSAYAAGFVGKFRDAVSVVLVRITSAPDVPGVNRLTVNTSVTRYVLSEAVIQLVEASLRDTTADRQKSAALIDRAVALVAEISTNRIAQRLVDLAKYSYEAGYLSLRR